MKHDYTRAVIICTLYITHLFFNSKDGDVVVEEDEEGKRSDLIEEIKEGLEKDNSDGKWDDLLTLPFLVFTL